MEKHPIFISPFVDRGFKLLFGQENSKELLIDLLNDLLEGERHIKDLEYINTELPSETTDGRGSVFDLKCKDQDGVQFIVELQNRQQPYFHERGLYYLCRAITSQGKPGELWKYDILPVYGIFFLNFRSGRTDKVLTNVVLADRETGKQVSNKIREIFIEFPLFNKTEEECNSPLDYWLYNLKNMEQLESLPFKGKKALFKRLEELARIVNMNKKEREEYEECLKVYRDEQNCWDYMRDTSIEEGWKKGQEEGRKVGMAEGLKEGLKEGQEKGERKKQLEIARNLKAQNIPVETISTCTGLSLSEIAEL